MPAAPRPVQAAPDAVPTTVHTTVGDRLAMAVPTALAMGAAGWMAAEHGGRPGSVGLVFGVFAGLLGVAGLPSLKPRSTGPAMVGVSAVILVGFATLGRPEAARLLLLWLLASTTVVGLAALQRHQASPPLPGSPAPRRPVGGVVALVLGVLLAVLVASPVVADRLQDRPGPGTPGRARVGAGSLLRAAPALDMTARPRLSDRVVMTVEADRPDFWRGETYDVWDGTFWSRSDPNAVRQVGSTGGGLVLPSADDLGARRGDELRQTYHLQAGSSDLLFAAASPVEVRAPGLVGQRPDATLLSSGLGGGASYTVISRRVPVTHDMLAVADRTGTRTTQERALQAEVVDRYTGHAAVTTRVASLGRSLTAGQSTTLGKVEAVEAWMGDHLTYSIDAPLAPQGRDVVDHFLFESRSGWCEQIASSLVVLLRSAGVPARLATGYAPGDADPLSGRFTVRERDAHAWAEVWFPGVGWQPFDPTADVPLAGEAPPVSLSGWVQDHLPTLLAWAAGLLVAGLAAWWASRLLRSRSNRRPARPPVPAEAAALLRWAAEASQRLERLGARRGVARGPAESTTAYGAALAAATGLGDAARVGAVVDAVLFRADPPGPDERAEVDRLLDGLERAPDPAVAGPVS